MSDIEDTKKRAAPQDANTNDDESKSTNNSNKTDTSDEDEELAKFPLCMCPGCDKVLGNMKSLFGHFGRTHRTAIDHDAIKYLCPFCEDGPDDEIFNSKAELESHVGKSHTGCKLLEYFTTNSSSGSSSKKKKKKSSSSSASQDEAPAPRRSSRQKEEIVPSSTKSNDSSSSSAKQRHLHPRCKCPSCDKILQPQGLFGHFGRVHSGQLGHVAKFEWKNVSFACPFCPEEEEGEQPRIFRTFELAEAHVASHHPNCHLTRPNALSNTPKGASSSSKSAKPDFASTLSSAQRKSQRSSRRSSINDDMDVDEDDGDDDTSPRKSQRRRRSVIAPSAKPSNESIKQAASVVNEEEDDKPLYSCPDCDKTNLTKHGLHAHYGMKHGGSVNMDRVKMVRKPKKKKPVNTSRTGPWTDEEHEAFLEGHRTYGNSWKRISAEFVPTRDAKQIGSHALNYFTTRGEWRDTLGSRTDGPRGRQRVVDDEEGNRRSKRESSGKSRFTIDMDNDIYDEEEYSVEAEDKEPSASEGDDGNSSHCIVCFAGGNIVCCSRCPRAYHPKCLAKDGHGGIWNVELLPNDWQCNRCKKDHQILPGEEIQQYAFGNKKIRAAFSEFKDCSDFSDCCALLSNILDILAKLKNHDYGFVFSEPVHLEDVPDYLEVVKTPMDYGTVIERLESGNYVDLIASDDLSRHDENSTMEEILLHVVCDIERVHHNCHLYNKQGSSIYRIGEVHANKWDAYFTHYIVDRLPENVQRDLALFRHRCKLELEEGDQESRSKKRKEAAKSSRITLTTNQKKKRKTSEPVEEEHDDIIDEDTDGEEEEEEHERQRKVNRATQEESTGHSSALLFTEEQLRSLEHLFFSSPTKLREELDDLDVCSTLTSPQASSPNVNDDVKIEDNPTDTPATAASGESEPLANAKSDEGLDEEKPNDQAPDAATTNEEEEKPDEKVPDVTSMPQNSDPQAPEEEPNIEKVPALPKSSSCSSLPSVIGTVDVENIASVAKSPNGGTPMSLEKCGNTIFQRQWYDRLNELKRYKVNHGTAVVGATKNDKLYHWRLRQRKRYHLTLFRMPHLKKDSHSWDDVGHSKDKEWLLALPEMKGVFALSTDQVEADDNAPKPFALNEKDIESDEKMVETICIKHREQLYCPAEQYCPSLPAEVLLSRHSSRFKNSLFWDECLEELRFFHGEHQHTIVPRDFPHNNLLPIWVEIQRAKYMLQNVGLFSGLTGSQVYALDELNFCDLSSVSTLDSILASSNPGGASKLYQKKKKFRGNVNAAERKSWTSQVSAFKEWFEMLPPEGKQRASDLLPRANWQLYSWCWRQCNGSAAALCGTPNISGLNLSARKLNILASAKFYHAFPYNDRSGLVREDDYEGCDAFESTFQVLEDFSIKYGSTHIPDWYECDGAFRMWVAALENGLIEFVKGEPCVLSARQIEKLILIGFCNDRDGLPNLTKSDVVWLKMFMELKRHRELFGVCSVSSNFPRLCHWVAEQKELFRLSRMGRKDMMNTSRLKMLMEVGIDFFTGECLPGAPDLIRNDFTHFEQLTSSPIEDFPANSSAMNAQPPSGWNFQYDSFWNNHDCRTKFEQFKTQHGHSLLLATDDEDVYWWFVEKRGKALLTEISQASEKNEFQSRTMLRYITAQANDEDDGESAGDDEVKVDHSMFTWLHYCERLLMFKARVGHCKIPEDYPDGALRRWLVQQHDLIHCYRSGQTTDLLPVQLKILQAIGVHGCKRPGAPPTPSSRTLKRKFPSKRDKKRGDSDKLKSSPKKNES